VTHRSPAGTARACAATFAAPSIAAAAAAATLVGFAGHAAAAEAPATDLQSYPSRPVRLIAAAAPGGGIDLLGRLLAQRLSDAWKQQVVVDNRAGSGGLIATELVVRANPDGQTLLMQSVGVSYVGTLNRNAPFDVLRDLAPVALVASQPSLLVVHPSVQAAKIGELVALAKAKPGLVTFGSGGAGGASHMGTELLANATGMKMVHVPYKGTGPSLAALLSGEVNVALVGISTVLPHVRSGKARGLGVSSTTRSSLAPDIPTIAEAGVPGYEFSGWYGLLAPAKTPRPIQERINTAVNAAIRHPEMLQQFGGNGFEPLGGSIDQFRKYFAAEVAKWKRVIAEAGIGNL
jgi:tripartite-type tricarboxylate transporter receptor subunit TctC